MLELALFLPGRIARNAYAAAAIALAAAALAAPATAAVQPAGSAARYYEDALARYERKDTAGAIIQLKNALKADPRMLAAHVLLGRAQLANGDPAAAEDAFAKALELGVDRSELALPMARALYAQGKLEAMLERFPAAAAPPAQRAELLVLRGHAYRTLGRTAAAKQAYEDAAAADPRHFPALVALAELALQQGNRAEAAKLAEQAIALAPRDPRPWHFKGTLALASGDVPAALAALGRALGIDAGYVDARIARASILIDLGRLDEAAPDIAYLTAHSPEEPRAIYLRAVFLGKRGDDAGARDALQAVVRLIDPVPREVLRERAPDLLLVGGLAHHGLNAPEKARQYLEEYLALRPREVGARRLLASIYMSQGRYREAIAVLEPARKDAPNDPQTLALLATAHIARHQYQLASGYLEQALRTSGDSPAVHATLGFSLLGSGQSDLGLDHLERAFRADPGQVRVGIALTVLYLRRGQSQLAVKTAEAVAARAPRNVIALNLLGVARGGSGDLRGARTAYEGALALDKGFLPAQLNLGKLERAERNAPAARSRFEAVLKAHPKNVAAMLELAATDESAGRPEEAIRWYEKVRSLDRGNVAATARLVDLHVAAKRAAQALEIAKETEATAPENIDALAALGRAYLAVGNAALAQTVFTRMVRLAGFDADRLTEIARYQLAAGNPQGAVYSLEKALAGNPEHLPAQVLLAEIDLERGEVAKAEQRARAIAKKRPDDPAGYRLLADIALARKQYPEAIAGYRTALAKERTTAAALRLFRAYVAAGKLAAANEFMESWAKPRPGDALAERALAEGYLRAGNLAAARARYEDVLKRHGPDPTVLNNLANILLQQRDRKARDYAEQAHRLAPGDALIQDTLGWVLVQQDEVDLGVRHLREARLRDPQNREIRYHLAAALARAGRRDEAKSELDEALRGDGPFEGVADARKLQQELSRR